MPFVPSLYSVLNIFNALELRAGKATGPDDVRYRVISITIAVRRPDPLALGLDPKLHKFT